MGKAGNWRLFSSIPVGCLPTKWPHWNRKTRGLLHSVNLKGAAPCARPSGLEHLSSVIICAGNGGYEVHPKGMNMRILIAAAVVFSMTGWHAFAQTQRTPPSAFATVPTMPSAFATAALSPCYPYASFNPTSSCYTGTRYASYSALEPFEFHTKTNRETGPGAESLDETQARLRIEAKEYSNVSGLQKDNHGIWRGKATMKDGTPVTVILDLEGNIYSLRIVTIHTR
jgi:hypothetical protein